MTVPVIQPPSPTNPLDRRGARSELRMVNGTLSWWDGTDWQPASVPATQLSAPISVDQATGKVTLASGLVVAGGATADSLVVSGALSADTVTAATDLIVTGWGSSPRGSAFTSSSPTPIGGITTTAVYAGVGVTWVYDASRRLILLTKCVVEGVGTNADVDGVMNIIGGLGNTVNSADPQLDASKGAVGSSVSATLFSALVIPPGQWANGVQVYVAAFLTTIGLTAGSMNLVAGATFPNYMHKIDLGT